VCEPAAISAAAGVGQAIVGYNAEKAAVNARNRARLQNFERANVQYLTDAMLDKAEYKNEIQLQEIRQSQVSQALVNQWAENDAQLDRIFDQGDFKLEEAIVEMHRNDYAGTQTGRTAARLAGQSARQLGFKKARIMHDMLVAKKDTKRKDDQVRDKARWDSWDLYEKVRYAPIHGHAPPPPTDLEAGPSMAGMILGAVGSVAGELEMGYDKAGNKTGIQFRRGESRR
tara:strand:+ start:645 stop:1328 length:684 start_codon:yes stop_codon:yes gene_type:complete